MHSTKSEVVPHLGQPWVRIDMIEGSIRMLRGLPKSNSVILPNLRHERFDAIELPVKIDSFSNQSDRVATRIAIQIDSIMHKTRKSRRPLSPLDSVVRPLVAVIV